MFKFYILNILLMDTTKVGFVESTLAQYLFYLVLI